jgi:hypothetical protein
MDPLVVGTLTQVSPILCCLQRKGSCSIIPGFWYGTTDRLDVAFLPRRQGDIAIKANGRSAGETPDTLIQIKETITNVNVF